MKSHCRPSNNEGLAAPDARVMIFGFLYNQIIFIEQGCTFKCCPSLNTKMNPYRRRFRIENASMDYSQIHIFQNVPALHSATPEVKQLTSGSQLANQKCQ